MEHDLHRSIVEHLPHLRAFALLLARDRALADDLVQETVVRALGHAHQFQPGTNFKAWISTILRNSYFNELRYRNRATLLAALSANGDRIVSGGQEENLELRDFTRAFHVLPPVQREALILVGASGFSYEEASEIARCSLGTMKSRVSRARIKLHEMLNGEAPLPGSGMEPVDERPGSSAALAHPRLAARRSGACVFC
ncbi:MAG TPA: sigma-70 family RNA polymerase sigma factor [Stellaceae bacterium]|nr:sigma-70 family RNA polymerase sigma factor [Stellaceae bacterium]